MNLKTLAGQTIFLDESKVADVVDKNYLTSTIRQSLLANNCQLKEKREDADFIVELRAGAVGTDRSDLLFGIPSMNVPQIPVVQPVPAVIPEIPIAKRKDQRGVAKIALFAYHRQSGAPVWQSGLVKQESSENDVWILGAGPFQRGTIYEGTEFAGNTIHNDPPKDKLTTRRLPAIDLAHENTFSAPQKFAKQTPPADSKIVQAAHQEPVAAPKILSPSPAAAVSPTASTGPKPTDPPQTAAKTPAPPASTPPKTDLSATTDASKSPAASSAYLQPGDTASLPQPRFNSPK
jgi:hypothetical protein